jgi:hypothetical protein
MPLRCQVAQHVLQLAGRELARSAGAVAVLGEATHRHCSSNLGADAMVELPGTQCAGHGGEEQST